LNPYAARLSAWLLAQTRKSRKDRRNVKVMYEDLVKLGYDGSYERVAAFARAWRADRHRAEQTTGRDIFVPLVFQPGEAFQFDWSEDWATIGGERVKLQVAHTKLSHSRAFLVRAYPLQTHEMLFDAYWHAFRGVPGRGIYGNMKTAVDRVGRGWRRTASWWYRIWRVPSLPLWCWSLRHRRLWPRRKALLRYCMGVSPFVWMQAPSLTGLPRLPMRCLHAHDVPVEPGADCCGDQTGGLPQGPAKPRNTNRGPTRRRLHLCTGGRSGQYAEGILKGFSGILQVDGYAGYNRRSQTRG